MRTLLIRTFAGISVLALFLPFRASPANSAWANPFNMRIVDAGGEGLSRVRVTSDEGYVCYTRADGSVLWTESSLMGRDVRFRVDAAVGKRVVTARVTPGGHAEFSVQAADLSGAWTLLLDPNFSGNAESVDCTFKQEAQKLTVTCGDALPAIGTVDDGKVSWQFKTGTDDRLTATQIGDVNALGTTITGTWHINRDKDADGKFTATKR